MLRWLGGIATGTAVASGTVLGSAGTTSNLLKADLSGPLGRATASFGLGYSAKEVEESINIHRERTGVSADARTLIALDFFNADANSVNAAGILNSNGGELTSPVTVQFELRGKNTDTTEDAPRITFTLVDTEKLEGLSNGLTVNPQKQVFRQGSLEMGV